MPSAAPLASRLLRCHTCGFASPRGTRFCPYCGLPPTYRPPALAGTSPPFPPGTLPDRLYIAESFVQGVTFPLVVSAFFPLIVMVAGDDPGRGLFAMVGLFALMAVWAFWKWRRLSPRRQKHGTLKEAERRLDVALAEARARFERLNHLAHVAPSGAAHAEATATLGQARHLLAARVDTLERARFDLRLVWWKNRIDAALDDEASGQATAHDTLEHLTTLRREAEAVVATLGPDIEDVYADLRPLLRDGVAALTTLTARLFDESVAEAVAGVTAPLDTLSPARASVQAALAELSAVVEAAPAVARADALTRETLRLDLEAEDLVADETRQATRRRA